MSAYSAAVCASDVVHYHDRSIYCTLAVVFKDGHRNLLPLADGRNCAGSALDSRIIGERRQWRGVLVIRCVLWRWGA